MSAPKGILKALCERPLDDECWLWTGKKNKDGYGISWRRNRAESTLVHRIVYERRIGAIPPGLTLDHRCRNHACANPTHLEPVTLVENIRRATVAGAYRGPRLNRRKAA